MNQDRTSQVFFNTKRHAGVMFEFQDNQGNVTPVTAALLETDGDHAILSTQEITSPDGDVRQTTFWKIPRHITETLPFNVEHSDSREKLAKGVGITLLTGAAVLGTIKVVSWLHNRKRD